MIQSQQTPHKSDPDEMLAATKAKVRARKPPDIRFGKTYTRMQSTRVVGE